MARGSVPPPFSVDTERREDGTIIIRIGGELDHATAGRLRGAVREAIDEGARRVQLDLTGLSFIGSTGLRTLLECRQMASQAGVESQVVCEPGGQIERVISVAGLARHLLGEEPGSDGG